MIIVIRVYMRAASHYHQVVNVHFICMVISCCCKSPLQVTRMRRRKSCTAQAYLYGIKVGGWLHVTGWAVTGSAALQVPHWQSWLTEQGVALRTQLLRLPYGDQAIFVSKQALQELQVRPRMQAWHILPACVSTAQPCLSHQPWSSHWIMTVMIERLSPCILMNTYDDYLCQGNIRALRQ